MRELRIAHPAQAATPLLLRRGVPTTGPFISGEIHVTNSITLEPAPEPEPLVIKLKYDMQNDKFELETNVKPQLVADLISDFLRMQIGKTQDHRLANNGPFELEQLRQRRPAGRDSAARLAQWFFRCS
jgi:hypothetical protein